MWVATFSDRDRKTFYDVYVVAERPATAMSAPSSEGRCVMRSRISHKLDLKLPPKMRGLCSNGSGQQQIVRSAHHLESFICNCLRHNHHVRPQTWHTPRPTSNTCAHKKTFKLVSRCSCRALAQMFCRLASWERPQSSLECTFRRPEKRINRDEN